MSKTRQRAMTWSLAAIGVAMVVLAAVLLAAGPAHVWAQAPAQTQGQTQGQGAPQGTPPAGPPAFGPWAGPGYWYGHPYGWFMRGPRFFGGGLLIALIVILAVSLMARRWGGWRYGRPDGWPDAEEILRRTFAEGRITEEEYKRRLSALRK